jgi:hypothetical protein
VAAIVIADASALIALARVNGLGWLEALFGPVLVSEEVMAEVLSGGYPAREEPIDERAGQAVAEDARIDVNPPSRPIYRCREGAAAGS